MNAYLMPSGIRFDDYVFSEPVRLAGWVPPKCPGVFVILTHDSGWAPKPFQALWFGQFGNNAPQRLFSAEHILEAESLFISVLAIPFSTAAQRHLICEHLISAYHPSLQTGGAAAPGASLTPKRRRIAGIGPIGEIGTLRNLS